jgi:hypothetical protein
MVFVGRSRPLSPDGMAAVASSLSVGVQEVWAVLNVETSGCGFLPDRRPQILYERHVFHRLTNGRFDDGDLSDPSAGGYGAGGAHQYDRLTAAMNLDREAALQSASWGLGQILGENFKVAGFASVDEMVQAMSDTEDAQLTAVGSFILDNRLDRVLAAHDWASFARGYNGPAFAINHYDVRLRGEFQKLQAGVLPNLDIRAAQLFLTFRGFQPGPVDGFVGPLTRSAIVDFQRKLGLDQTGLVDDDLLEKLLLP